MNLERDKFLTEAMGECYHDNEWGMHFIEHDAEHPDYVPRCKKCSIINKYNTNFSTWPGFGKLIIWLKDTEYWQKIRWNMPMFEFMELMTDPNKAANAFYEYLKNTKG